MSLTKFLLRLVGRSPEQLQELDRFEKNVRRLGSREEELDRLLEEIREMDQAYQGKKEAFEKTTRSVRPEAEGPDDDRTKLASEQDLSG